MKRLLLFFTICISSFSFGQSPNVQFFASNSSICLGDSVVLTAQLQVASNPLNFPYTKNIGNEIFVSPTGNNNTGDGTQLNAYETVQYAIGTAANGDIITLLNGVFSGVGNINISTQGKQIIVQSQNGPLFTTIDCNFSERAFKINQGESMSTIIKGISIINGQTSSSPTGYGSAIFVEDNSGLMIEDCFFENNLEGCIAFGDTETTGPESGVSNCAFISNSISCISGSKKRFNVENCFFYGNTTSGALTGNAHVVSPAPIFSNCIFQCNSGQFGPSLGHGQIFQNSLFINNQNIGGIIRFGTNFTGNASNLDHCTFYNNICGYFNGTFSNHTGMVTSTIFFPGEARDHVSGWQSSISFSNSLGDGITGNGNIQGNPDFVDPNNFDFTLSGGSPCIGSGAGGSNMGADISQIPIWMFNFLENYNYTANYNDVLWENGSSQDTIVIFPNSTEYISISFLDNGCGGVIQDSILISVSQPTTSNIIESNCDTYIAPDGIIYTTSGNYTAVISNTVGCDSTITIDLTITNSSSSSITETVCDTYTAPDGTIYTTTGNYTTIIPNALGCDSTIIIDLTISNSNTGSETITECSSYTWGANNQTYTSSGQYTEVLTNAVGCDSTVILDLVINSVDNGITQVDDFTLQANATGASYQWIDCADESAVVGATNQQFAPAENGDYAVIVTQNGCSDTSECLSVSRLSILEHEQTLLVVYPNPATSMITIENPQGIASNYVVIDAQGRQVNAGKLQGETTSIDVVHIANGMYTITFEKNNLKDIKFIKK